MSNMQYMKPRVLGSLKMTSEIGGIITGPLSYDLDIMPKLIDSFKKHNNEDKDSVTPFTGWFNISDNFGVVNA